MCKEECKSEEMKYRLAEAVKVCMKTTSVEKITVKEIVDACGTTRQTFYRHFQDKYDLVNWYFDKILLESFEHMGEGETIYEGLVKKFQYIQKEKLFFKMAFKSDDRSSTMESPLPFQYPIGSTRHVFSISEGSVVSSPFVSYPPGTGSFCPFRRQSSIFP